MSFFKKTPEINTDSAKIHEFLTRGVEHVFPSSEFLEKELKSGRRLKLYLGVDPTGPTLHVGHMIPLLKLSQFQEFGHEAILLIGDFTATIGDPDKMTTRVPLSHEQVLKNAKQYKEQASKVLNFNGTNPAKLMYNASWLGKLSFAEIIGILSKVTHAQIVKRDMFQKRIEEGKDLAMSELLYPVLQGYDSVAMEADGEVGGNDQTFNMLMGRDMVKVIQKREKFVVSTKLLADPTGKKMGKTEGNMVAFSDTPTDVFGKVMSWPDGQILPGFELCTRVSSGDIEGVKSALERGENPRNLKARLAEEITALIHGKSEAAKSFADFNATFSEGKPQEFVVVSLSGKEIAEALIDAKVVASKTELRRLIAEGAITNLDTGVKMGEDFLKTATAGKYRIGKHRFIEIT